MEMQWKRRCEKWRKCEIIKHINYETKKNVYERIQIENNVQYLKLK